MKRARQSNLFKKKYQKLFRYSQRFSVNLYKKYSSLKLSDLEELPYWGE